MDKFMLRTLDYKIQEKAETMGRRLLDINPDLKLSIIGEYIRDERMIEIIDQPFDYVVDAIDTLAPKVFLSRTYTATWTPCSDLPQSLTLMKACFKKCAPQKPPCLLRKCVSPLKMKQSSRNRPRIRKSVTPSLNRGRSFLSSQTQLSVARWFLCCLASRRTDSKFS